MTGSEKPRERFLSTLEFARKLSPGHERIAVHGNSPEKGTQRVEKRPGTLKFLWKLPPGRYLQRVPLSTETFLKNVLSSSEKPPGTLKFVRKFPPGFYLPDVSLSTERVLRNVLSRSNNPQVHSNSQGSHLLGMSVSLYTEIVIKNVLSGS